MLGVNRRKTDATTRTIPVRRQRDPGHRAGCTAAQTPLARAVWRPEPDLRTSTKAWLTAGGPHHTVLSTALTSERLWDLAEMTRVERALIDADTTSRRFTQELRWNQAYHRLAKGL